MKILLTIFVASLILYFLKISSDREPEKEKVIEPTLNIEYDCSEYILSTVLLFRQTFISYNIL